MKGSSTIARKNDLKGMWRLRRSASHSPSANLMTLATHRIEERVEERQLRHAVGHQVLEVVDPDPHPGAPDLGVGEAEPGAEPEGIRKEDQQQHARGQHENEAEEVAVI
jgi:hypothetical protein